MRPENVSVKYAQKFKAKYDGANGTVFWARVSALDEPARREVSWLGKALQGLEGMVLARLEHAEGEQERAADPVFQRTPGKPSHMIGPNHCGTCRQLPCACTQVESGDIDGKVAAE